MVYRCRASYNRKKDYYVKGLSKEMQIALKSLADFAAKQLNDLAEETSRLEIAGIGAEVKAVKVVDGEESKNHEEYTRYC